MRQSIGTTTDGMPSGLSPQGDTESPATAVATRQGKILFSGTGGGKPRLPAAAAKNKKAKEYFDVQDNEIPLPLHVRVHGGRQASSNPAEETVFVFVRVAMVRRTRAPWFAYDYRLTRQHIKRLSLLHWL